MHERDEKGVSFGQKMGREETTQKT